VLIFVPSFAQPKRMAWFLFEAMQADDEEDEEVKIPMDVDVDEIVEDDLDAEVDEIHNHTTSDKTKKVYSCVASNFPSSPGSPPSVSCLLVGLQIQTSAIHSLLAQASP